MATTTESSAMFSLAMLTKEALPAAAEPDEPPMPSLPQAFAPVLAMPVAHEVKPRVRGWVFVAAFFAMMAPIASAGILAMRTPVPVRPRAAAPLVTAIVTSTSTETAIATASVTATADPSQQRPRVQHKPPSTIIATSTAVKSKEAPKCCPGETEMQCAMRSSVGAACGA